MFDYDSLHKRFEALETVDKSVVDVHTIRMARANLASWVRGLTKPDDDSTMATQFQQRDAGKIFIGTAESLASVQVVPAVGSSMTIETGANTPAHFLAQLVGKEGLEPEAAYHLAASIHKSLEKNSVEFNPLTWQLLSNDALTDMIGALNARIVATALRTPCPEPNLLEALKLQRPAPVDLRPDVLMRVVTPDTRDLTWILTETHAALQAGVSIASVGAVRVYDHGRLTLHNKALERQRAAATAGQTITKTAAEIIQNQNAGARNLAQIYGQPVTPAMTEFMKKYLQQPAPSFRDDALDAQRAIEPRSAPPAPPNIHGLIRARDEACHAARYRGESDAAIHHLASTYNEAIKQLAATELKSPNYNPIRGGKLEW